MEKKSLHFEIMRLTAIFWVIFNHTGRYGFFLFSSVEPEEPKFWIYLFFSVFCKFAVPLFLAISGALMLNRPDERLRDVWTKRIFKIAGILAFYSLAYYIYNSIVSGKTMSVREFVVNLYSSGVQGHLWYLYLYIAYLAVLPFLRAMVKELKDKYFYYMFFVALFFNGIIPSLEYIFLKDSVTINSALKIVWLADSAVLYPCLGYFMQHRLTREKVKKLLPWLWIAAIVGVFISGYVTYYKGMITGVMEEHDSQEFFDDFAILSCSAIFLSIRLLFEDAGRIPEGIKKLIYSMGSCTFGIYLIHMWVRDIPLLDRIFEFLKNAGWGNMFCILVICFLIMSVSYAIVLIMSKLPVIKKLVGF